MAKLFIQIAAFNGLLAVILGAFGAHYLKSKLTLTSMSAYETAIDYHFWHTLALLCVGLLSLHWPQSKTLVASGWSFTVGMGLFSGSLYVLATTSLRQLGFINIGLLTPLGGLCLIVGWALLLAAVTKQL